MNDLACAEVLSLKTTRELDRFAKAWLLDSLADYEFIQRSTTLSDPSRKWRASSAWQKSIRRGDVETALRMVNALWKDDPQYVLRRLPVILLEDLGWADPDLLLAGMHICTQKTWLAEKSNPRKAMYYLTERAARSAKDRSCCDLTVYADSMFNLDQEIRKRFLMPEDGEREAIVADGFGAHPDVTFMSALWSLAGTKGYDGDRVVAPSERPEALRDYMEALPGPAYLAWRTARSRMSNGMPLAAPIQYLRMMEGKLRWDAPDPHIPEVSLIGKMPSYTYDWYTREGRSALKYFIKACGPMREALAGAMDLSDMNDAASCLSTVLFRVEGAVVDRRLHYEGSQEMVDTVTTALCADYKVGPEHYDSVAGTLLQNLEELNRARSRIVGVS